jgi:uncharacterized membrane protein
MASARSPVSCQGSGGSALGSVVFIVLVVALILWAIRRAAPPAEDPAIAELKARSARGEIETAEFQVRLRELSGE